MKYIMLKGDGYLIPIIFPDFIYHDEMARAVAGLDNPACNEASSISAGFIGIRDMQCSGDSNTLELSAHPEDEAIIAAYQYFHGMNSGRLDD